MRYIGRPDTEAIKPVIKTVLLPFLILLCVLATIAEWVTFGVVKGHQICADLGDWYGKGETTQNVAHYDGPW